MINLFQMAPNDASYQYLGQIFGSMNGVLAGQGVGSLSILGAMFKTFNSTILAVAALLLVYMTVVGVMQTAHEGEFMGKKWNNIWIPIRSVLGIALLVPTGSGFCGLQIVMMWVIVQGIGAADTLWNTALSYVNVVGSPYAQGDLPSTGVDNVFQSMFAGLVCDASARVTKADPTGVSGGNYYCSGRGGSFCSTPLTVNSGASTLQVGPDGACGTLTYCDTASKCATDSSSLECLACQAQVTSLQAILPTLSGIATEMVNADYAFRDFTANSGSPSANRSSYSWIYNWCSSKGIPQSKCCVKSDALISNCPEGTEFPNLNDGGRPQNASAEAVQMYWQFWPQLGPNLGDKAQFLATASNYYMENATKAYSNYIAALGNQPPSGKLADAQNSGWIFAGGYYYTIANLNGGNLRSALPSIDWKAPNIGSNTMAEYRNNYTAAAALLSAASGNANSVSQPGDQTMGSIASGVGSVSKTFEASVSNQSAKNPLVQLQMIGSVMLLVVEIIFYVIVAIIVTVGIVGFINVYVLGSGADNPLGPAAQFLFLFFIPIIFALLAYMVTLGAMLAIYTPLVPYIIFTFGAIHWLVSVVEAMVAGPIVALGIISPSGEHELLGKAHHALMLLFSVFLRPSLMIFGLIAAMLLSVVVVKMINALFWPVVYTGITRSGAPSGLLSILLFLGAYVMLICSALNKCFETINYIPQQVMRWIGGHGEAVQAPVGEIKGGVDRVAGGAQGAIEGSKGAMAHAREGAGKDHTKKSTISGSNKP